MAKMIFKLVSALPRFIMYHVYDKLQYIRYKEKKTFTGWGIHLFVGRFGAGKTSTMVKLAYDLCRQYKQLTVVTNISLKNFPDWTNIIPLRTVDDILNAPPDTLVLIDEIGTLFNSRDFSSGERLPKSLFQHLCQCRKRRMMIYGTVQRYCLLDKQIRDVSATVSDCKVYFKHPFSRLCIVSTYDVDDWDLYQSNPMYTPKRLDSKVYVQSEKHRQLYDTSALVEGLLKQKYIPDNEILQNRGESERSLTEVSRKQNRKIRKRLW